MAGLLSRYGMLRIVAHTRTREQAARWTGSRPGPASALSGTRGAGMTTWAAPGAGQPSQHLPRIEYPLRVERGFDAAHQVELDGALHAGEVGAFHLADAVLGGNGAAKLDDDRLHGLRHAIPQGKVGRLRHAHRLGDVVVHVAVAEMR